MTEDDVGKAAARGGPADVDVARSGGEGSGVEVGRSLRDEGGSGWHVVTKSHGGSVSVLGNLDERTAKLTAFNVDARLRWPRDGMFHIDQGDIVNVWLLGPKGADTTYCRWDAAEEGYVSIYEGDAARP